MSEVEKEEKMETDKKMKTDLPQRTSRKRKAPESFDTDMSKGGTPNPILKSKDPMELEEVRKAEEIATRIIAAETAPANSTLVSQGSEDSPKLDKPVIFEDSTSSSSEEAEEGKEEEAEEVEENYDEGQDTEVIQEATAKPYNLHSRGLVAMARRL